MSTEALVLRVLPVALVAIAALLGAGSARAAQVLFRPSLDFGLYHDGNVNVVNYDAATGEETSSRGDDLAHLAIDLAVERNTPNSKLSFAYRPAYRKYRTEGNPDFFENAVLLAYTRESSGGTRTDVGCDALRTESQSIRSFNAERPSTLVPRTVLTRARAHVDGTLAASRRSFVDWGIQSLIDRYDPVAGVTFQNDTSASVRGAWRYALSERGSLGVALDVGWIGYDAVVTSGSEPADSLANVVNQNLSLVGTQSVGRMTALEYGAGVIRATSAGRSFTDGAFHFTVDRRVAKVSEFRAGVGRAVTPGTGVSKSTTTGTGQSTSFGFDGASIDTGGWLAFSRTPPRRGWSGSVNGGYWLRRSIQSASTPEGGASEQNGHATTLNVSGSVGWSFSEHLALNASYAYVDQGTAGSSSKALDSRYATYGIFLRWALRGR